MYDINKVQSGIEILDKDNNTSIIVSERLFENMFKTFVMDAPESSDKILFIMKSSELPRSSNFIDDIDGKICGSFPRDGMNDLVYKAFDTSDNKYKNIIHYRIQEYENMGYIIYGKPYIMKISDSYKAYDQALYDEERRGYKFDLHFNNMSRWNKYDKRSYFIFGEFRNYGNNSSSIEQNFYSKVCELCMTSGMDYVEFDKLVTKYLEDNPYFCKYNFDKCTYVYCADAKAMNGYILLQSNVRDLSDEESYDIVVSGLETDNLNKLYLGSTQYFKLNYDVTVRGNVVIDDLTIDSDKYKLNFDFYNTSITCGRLYLKSKKNAKVLFSKNRRRMSGIEYNLEISSSALNSILYATGFQRFFVKNFKKNPNCVYKLIDKVDINKFLTQEDWDYLKEDKVKVGFGRWDSVDYVNNSYIKLFILSKLQNIIISDDMKQKIDIIMKKFKHIDIEREGKYSYSSCYLYLYENHKSTAYTATDDLIKEIANKIR